MTGPLGNSEFCFPQISMFLEILGKQNSLFPSGPVIKCLLFHSNEMQLLYIALNLCVRLLPKLWFSVLQNRKNDEASYEKMLKLRRDLNRACTILDMVKRREQSKKELLQLTVEVFEKRYDSQFNFKMLNTFFHTFHTTNLNIPDMLLEIMQVKYFNSVWT